MPPLPSNSVGKADPARADLTISVTHAIVLQADLDGDGEVNEDEFMRIMTYKHSFKAA